MVGVRQPFSIDHGSRAITSILSHWYSGSVAFTSASSASSAASTLVRTAGSSRLPRKFSSSTTRPNGADWPTPETMAISIMGCALSWFSTGTGAMNLPLLVLNSSFTRPVIFSSPSGRRSHRSPVRKKPSSVNDSAVSSGCLK